MTDVTGKILLAGAIAAAIVLAAVPPGAQAQSDEQVMLNSDAFLADHRDLLNRLRGMQAYERGDHAGAMEYFRSAAFYADKPSQAMVADLLWNGHGVERDPALAYAWMDLAAERGYPAFLAVRERIWNQLDDVQRERAIVRGEEIYAEYGDDVAKPRVARMLRNARRKMTGSRTGFAGFLTVHIPGPGGNIQSIDGSRYYDEKFWEPEKYHAWHDEVWMDYKGRVDVGDVEVVRDGEADGDGD